MLSGAAGNLVVMAMAMICAGGVAYVFLYPILSGERQREKRMAAVKSPLSRSAKVEMREQRNKSRKVQDTLKDIEANAKSGTDKQTLKARIQQSGLTMSLQTFIVFSIIFGCIFGAVIYISFGSALLAGATAFSAGFGVPRWMLGFLTRRRQKKFIKALPDAIDVIVRGVKAGLPLNDCLRIVAAEAQEPVRSEFREVIDSQAIGVQAAEALSRMYKRIPLAEVNFFAITVAIQQTSGGNLSEALGNLSKVLRERKKMTGKIQAMSQEAKASAAIIGALPLVVMTLVYMTSPDYIELLWTERMGQIMLAGSAVWMTIGVLVMRKMINFDF